MQSQKITRVGRSSSAPIALTDSNEKISRVRDQMLAHGPATSPPSIEGDDIVHQKGEFTRAQWLVASWHQLSIEELLARIETMPADHVLIACSRQGKESDRKRAYALALERHPRCWELLLPRRWGAPSHCPAEWRIAHDVARLLPKTLLWKHLDQSSANQVDLIFGYCNKESIRDYYQSLDKTKLEQLIYRASIYPRSPEARQLLFAVQSGAWEASQIADVINRTYRKAPLVQVVPDRQLIETLVQLTLFCGISLEGREEAIEMAKRADLAALAVRKPQWLCHLLPTLVTAHSEPCDPPTLSGGREINTLLHNLYLLNCYDTLYYKPSKETLDTAKKESNRLFDPFSHLLPHSLVRRALDLSRYAEKIDKLPAEASPILTVSDLLKGLETSDGHLFIIHCDLFYREIVAITADDTYATWAQDHPETIEKIKDHLLQRLPNNR